MDALLRDVPAPKAPAKPPLAAPAAPDLPPPGELLPLLRTVLGGALFGVAVGLLHALTTHAQEQQVHDAIERFKLDPKNPADAAAAFAYVWAEYKGPWLFDTPQTGPAMQATAERVMRAVRADPTLLARALEGDRPSMATLLAMAQGKTVPGSGIETRNDEERALVAQMMRQGMGGAAIQTALDSLRAKAAPAPAPAPAQQVPAKNTVPPVQQMPPWQLRFSQRTAGGNGRAEKWRKYVSENGEIPVPIDAVRTPDGIVAIDNTRIAVALEHGLKTVPVRVWEPNDPLSPNTAKRFEGLKTWGEVLKFRVQRQWPELPPHGTTKAPSLPKRK